MRKLTLCLALMGVIAVMLALSGCGSDARKSDQSQTENEAADKTLASGPYWLIEVSDTKNFTYKIPVGNGGAIDMTATLYFIAWKQGGSEIFGQYEGRALVALDMDLSKAGTGGVSYTGGVMDDSISDNISFELLPVQQKTVTAEGEDIDLAPLTKFIGQSEIITRDYMISQQTWKALADGEVKLDVNGSFGDGTKYPQGFGLKAGEDSVLISVADLTAAYGLEPFSGTITKADTPPDALSWFRDKVMSRMEERLALSEQSAGPQMPETGSDDAAAQSGLTVDSEGREGMDTNGDGRLEVYYGVDGHVWQDFDGDGKYEIAGEDGSDMD